MRCVDANGRVRLVEEIGGGDVRELRGQTPRVLCVGGEGLFHQSQALHSGRAGVRAATARPKTKSHDHKGHGYPEHSRWGKGKGVPAGCRMKQPAPELQARRVGTVLAGDARHDDTASPGGVAILVTRSSGYSLVSVDLEREPVYYLYLFER